MAETPMRRSLYNDYDTDCGKDYRSSEQYRNNAALHQSDTKESEPPVTPTGDKRSYTDSDFYSGFERSYNRTGLGYATRQRTEHTDSYLPFGRRGSDYGF